MLTNINFLCFDIIVICKKSLVVKISGMEVKNLYEAGRVKDIAAYCSHDVFATYQLYKIWDEYLAHP